MVHLQISLVIISKVLNQSFKSFKTYFKESNVIWKLILEKPPLWGGFYERLITILKSVLRKIVESVKVNFEELHTVLYKYIIKT